MHLLQRKAAPLGKGLGKTTGWIHRAALKAKRVEMIGGVNYERIDERGLHLSFGEAHEKPMLLEVDTVVLCAGQEPLRELEAPLRAAGRERAPDRRRGRRRGTRRQARDRPGLAPGRAPVADGYSSDNGTRARRGPQDFARNAFCISSGAKPGTAAPGCVA